MSATYSARPIGGGTVRTDDGLLAPQWEPRSALLVRSYLRPA